MDTFGRSHGTMDKPVFSSRSSQLRESFREFKEPYVQSLRDIRGHMSERFRVRVAELSAKNAQRTQKGAKARCGAASMATTLAVARVFKGNVVAANMLKTLVKGQRMKLSGSSPSSSSSDGQASKAVAAVMAAAGVSGASLATAETAQAEGLMLGSKLGSGVRECYTAVGAVTGDKKEEAFGLVVPPGQEAVGKVKEILDETTPLQRLVQAVTVPVLGTVCQVFMHGLNRTEVYGGERLEQAVRNRPAGQALVTVCNHVASMDDPLVLAAILPPSAILNARAMRWTLCATDRCFTNPAASAFFRAAKVLPVERGAGVFQKGLDTAVAKLEQGDWVHIFPEGSRSRDQGRTLQSIKRGIGRLVAEPQQPPLVVPFVHLGMGGIIPVGSKVPSVGNEVAVLVGEPVPVEDLLIEHRDQGTSQKDLYDAIAARVEVALKQLKEELEDKVRIRREVEPIEVLSLPLEWDEVDGKRVWDIIMAQTQRESFLAAWLAQPVEATSRSSSKPGTSTVDAKKDDATTSSPSVGRVDGRRAQVDCSFEEGASGSEIVQEPLTIFDFREEDWKGFEMVRGPLDGRPGRLMGFAAQALLENVRVASDDCASPSVDAGERGGVTGMQRLKAYMHERRSKVMDSWKVHASYRPWGHSDEH